MKQIKIAVFRPDSDPKGVSYWILEHENTYYRDGGSWVPTKTAAKLFTSYEDAANFSSSEGMKVISEQ